MRWFKVYGIHAVVALSALITLALLLWPAAAPDPVPPPQAQAYAGPVYPLRPTARARTSVLQLASDRPATPAPTVPTPVLVGIAGRSAYLRSASTGETARLTVGQEMDSWRLIAVGARTATLRGAAGDRRLELFAPGASASDRGTGDAAPVGG